MNANPFPICLLIAIAILGTANTTFGQSNSPRRDVRPPAVVKQKVRRVSTQQQSAEPVVDPAEPADEPAPQPESPPAAAEEIAPGTPGTRRGTTTAPRSVVRPYYSDGNVASDVDTFFSDDQTYETDGFSDGYGGWCGDCRRGIYAGGEVLSIWSSGQRVPALVTTSPNGTARDQAGELPNATIVYGNDDLNTKARSGGRARVGYWLTDCFALELDYVALGEVNDSFNQTSTTFGTPTIGRPFFNAGINVPANDVDLIAFNDGQQAIYTGSIQIDSSSSFEASSLLVRRFAAARQEGFSEYRADWLFGYRYARLRDRLSISTTRTSVSNTEVFIPINTVFDVRDSFETTNRFMGADLGLYLQCRQGWWTFDVTGRLAFGSIARQVDIDGETTNTVPAAAPFTTPGGLLAQRSNMGRYRTDEFALLPEVGAKLGLDISPLLRLTVGYNFYALTNVARAGEQIDTNLNLTQAGQQPLVGEARPAFSLVDTSFWAHGISFGLEGDF